MPYTRAERAAMLDRLRDQARIGEALIGVGDMLTAGLDVSEVLQRLTEAATRLVGADYGAFFPRQPDLAEGPRVFTVDRAAKHRFRNLPALPPDALSCSPNAGDGAIRINDVTTDARCRQRPPYAGLPPGHPPVRSYLAVPVVGRDGQLEGGLSFGAQEAGVFGRPAERHAMALAQQAGLAIHNARLYAAERTARLAAEESAQQLAVLQQVATSLADARGLAAVADAVIDAASTGTGADGVLVGLLDEDGKSLLLVAETGIERKSQPHWRRIPTVAGRPGHDALLTGAPVLLPSVEERRRRYPHFVAEAGPQASWAVMPLIVDGDCIGIVSFSWRTEQRFAAPMLSLLTGVAQQAAQALARARLDEAAQLARQRGELLADASRLLSGALDPDLALMALARLLVPGYADAVSIARVDRTALRTVASVHIDPTREQEMRAAADDPRNGGQPVLLGVLAAGRSLYVPDTAVAEGAAATEGLGPPTVRDGLTSVIITPLHARGAQFGVLTLAMASSGRHQTRGDVALAEDLGRRCSACLDSALRYQRERQAAIALQQALLPSRLPTLEAVTAAVRYVPGAVGTRVGGDWYDVLELSAGRVGLAVGDVMGHGLTAAATMGQLRSAMRAYATMDLPPAAVMTRMDAVVSELATVPSNEQLVTCVFGVYEPDTGRLTYAIAGHPPPLLLSPGGRVTRLPLTAGVPLGVGGVRYEQRQLILPAEAVLVLYTDGLVESRTRDVDSGVNQLSELLRNAPADLDELCERVLGLAGAPTARRDDVALLAVRLGRPAR